MRQQSGEALNAGALEGGPEVRAFEVLGEAEVIGRGSRIEEAEDQQRAAHVLPHRDVLVDLGEGAQRDVHPRVVELVALDEHAVDAAGVQFFLCGLQELGAVQHLDSGDPDVARSRDDHVVGHVGAHQGAVGVALDHMDLRIAGGSLGREVEERRRLQHSRGDLGDVDACHAFKAAELASGGADSPPDHEGALELFCQHRRQHGQESHGPVVGIGIPVAFSVGRQRP